MPFVGPIETLQIFEWKLSHPHAVSEAISKAAIQQAFSVMNVSPTYTFAGRAFTD
jgi:hypothetical protein